MKIIGIASKPSTSMPASAFTEGENGPTTVVWSRWASQVSAVRVRAATTASSSMASSAPNWPGEVPTGLMSPL